MRGIRWLGQGFGYDPPQIDAAKPPPNVSVLISDCERSTQECTFSYPLLLCYNIPGEPEYSAILLLCEWAVIVYTVASNRSIRHIRVQQETTDMKFVTRRGVRLDRTACAWLIFRHIDPNAEILYADEENLPEAIEQGALPFHNTVSEDPGLRERTSFQELMAEYKLDDTDNALALMGDIVRGAETKEPG